MKSTDTVKAKLTPREAILNRNAAELLGRHNIVRLNAHGNMLAKRGVDLASDPAPHPAGQNLEGYQRGTPDVRPYPVDIRNPISLTGLPLLRDPRETMAAPYPMQRVMPTYHEVPPGKYNPKRGEYQMGSYDVGDDRTDLMREADSTFYGGGQAPMPTPTPTPIPQRYQYGTEDVRRRRNAASRVRFPQGQIIQGSGAGSGGYEYAPGTGALPPDQNPAYQAAIRNNPTPASRYAQRGPAQMVGTYQGDYGQRAVVSTGANSFRTYDPQGGYIGRTGNAANFLNKQFSPVPSNPAPAPVQPMNTQSVATTPTSLAVNTRGFQPSGLEANPFTEPVKLELQQPRRYSDLY